MIDHDDLSDQAKSWINGKITKIKQLKDSYQVSSSTETEQILRFFTNKKRSINPIPTASLEGLRHKIELSIIEERPIRLITSFGSYKPTNLPSPITANWAEFIHLVYMAEMASQISSIYAPGVEIAYKLGDIDMSLLADVTDEAVHQYFQAFKKLVDQFNCWVPSNVKFQVSRLSDYVSEEEFRQAVEVEIERLKPVWEEKRKNCQAIEVFERSKRNNANLNLSDEEIFEKALRSAAMIILDTSYLFEEKAINLVNRKLTEFIMQSVQGKTLFPFRSCSGGLVQFWVGEGGLIWNGKKIYPVIFGQNSIQNAKLLKTIDSYEFQEWGANFSQIRVYAP